MPVFSADALHVQLDDRPILHDLGFTVEPETWTALVGPNGSGKTTLLRTLGGLLPYSGALGLDGQPVRSWKPRALAQRLAFVRQSPSLAFDFTVEEFVLLGRAPHHGWLEGLTAGDRQRAHDALAELDLLGFADRALDTLSGGEQQRVQLAQAIAQEAGVLLLDEPTAHLDVHHQFDGMDRVAALTPRRTVVAAFHDLAFAARYADRLLVLDRGRIVADGPPAAVLTPDLIRSVFRMEADVVSALDRPLDIRYLAPV
jgi:iron complex transport system ATP-binding protein